MHWGAQQIELGVQLLQRRFLVVALVADDHEAQQRPHAAADLGAQNVPLRLRELPQCAAADKLKAPMVVRGCFIARTPCRGSP